jgi:hypothetical protein
MLSVPSGIAPTIRAMLAEVARREAAPNGKGSILRLSAESQAGHVYELVIYGTPEQKAEQLTTVAVLAILQAKQLKEET